ncbi:tRNA guanosine(34) transglycosylase Tgt [Blattabacterium cuenoti]|uniref:tRNA guanosine(34) transglycosylase Tgt n=1 Tax=Blattabacterium cuenoti TaxID=1653831 RepID=UPI00163BF39F|nr:tRNA guanosine(34) transglycosylase Tgt [Blattabacterium cuenoti]
MKFYLIKKDCFSKARLGLIQTDHGNIQTPTFMPVASKGYVKSTPIQDLYKISDIILGNTYHLYFQPGIDIIRRTGGIHPFMNWKKPILTDSGGYQVFSMKKINKITDNGVYFKSLLNGSSHFFSPEKSMEIQRMIGGDIIMSFDDCPSYPCSYSEAEQSVDKNLFWLKRCSYFLEKKNELYPHKQGFFPVIQGSIYTDLRKKYIKNMNTIKADGYAIGGLGLGESKKDAYNVINVLTDILPHEKPRYLMGIGNPTDLLEGISMGIDMFDCVIPTRNGRHGMIFTWNGILNIKNKKWKYDCSFLDKNGDSYVDTLYNKSYIRHLFLSKENLGKEIISIHNLSFYYKLISQSRKHIMNNDFLLWKNSITPNLTKRL